MKNNYLKNINFDNSNNLNEEIIDYDLRGFPSEILTINDCIKLLKVHNLTVYNEFDGINIKGEVNFQEKLSIDKYLSDILLNSKFGNETYLFSDSSTSKIKFRNIYALLDKNSDIKLDFLKDSSLDKLIYLNSMLNSFDRNNIKYSVKGDNIIFYGFEELKQFSSKDRNISELIDSLNFYSNFFIINSYKID